MTCAPGVFLSTQTLCPTILELCGYLPSPMKVPGQRTKILSGKGRGPSPTRASVGPDFLFPPGLPYSQWVLSL